MKNWKIILSEKDSGLNVRSFYVRAKTLLHATIIAGRACEKFFSNYSIENIVRVY